MQSKLLITLLLCVITFSVFSQTATQVETYNVKVSSKLELRGLTHVRFQSFEDTNKIDGFDIRRARIEIRGNVAPKIDYRLQLEMAGSPRVLDATFVYKPYEWLNVNLGQSKPTFCYDNFNSPYTLYTVSRTQIDNSLAFRGSDLYGDQQGRDIGAWLTGKISLGKEEKKRPIIDYTVGIYNGAGINKTDNNSAKNIGASLGVSPVKDLWIFGRYYSGTTQTFAEPGVDVNMSRIGGSFKYTYKNFILDGEYLAASEESDSLSLLERNGYFFTLGYSPIKDKLQFLVRLDNFDKDANKELNISNMYVVGGTWFFTKNTRIQIEYDLVREEDADNQLKNNVFAIQFQAAF